MSQSSRAITILATTLEAVAEGRVGTPEQGAVRDLLSLACRQGDILQVRVLLTQSPVGKPYLHMLPAPRWFSECWPGDGWSRTLPASEPHPFFSVVTPSFNQGVFLRDAIAGVLGQGFDSYEHIVMDGGSTDTTLDVLRAHPHLRWTSEPDRGQTHALNKALALARGEVIAWINSDDFHLPGAFHAVHEFFRTHPEEDILMGDCLWGWEGSGRLRYVMGRERDFESLIRQWDNHVPGPQPSIFFRRRVLEETGLGDESMHYGMDYDLWLRMAVAGHVRRYVSAPLAFYRFHSLSKSGDVQDWSPFYRDWQTCFSRYRVHSRVLPRQRMLAVAYPLSRTAGARERAALCGALAECAKWKLRDMELVLVTDADGVADRLVPAGEDAAELRDLLPGLGRLSLPLHIVCSAMPDGHAFVNAVLGATSAFAVCMPLVTSQVLYEQWFVQPLNALVDTPQLARAPLVLRGGHAPRHPLLPVQGELGCLAMHRREALAASLEAAGVVKDNARVAPDAPRGPMVRKEDHGEGTGFVHPESQQSKS